MICRDIVLGCINYSLVNPNNWRWLKTGVLSHGIMISSVTLRSLLTQQVIKDWVLRLRNISILKQVLSFGINWILLRFNHKSPHLFFSPLHLASLVRHLSQSSPLLSCCPVSCLRCLLSHLCFHLTLFIPTSVCMFFPLWFSLWVSLAPVRSRHHPMLCSSTSPCTDESWTTFTANKPSNVPGWHRTWWVDALCCF